MRFYSAILAAFVFLFPGNLRSAAIQWEECIDRGDFKFDYYPPLLAPAESFSTSKKGCVFLFAISGGSGEKLQIDVCGPVPQILYYPTSDSLPKKFFGGSAACPAPLFGADFDEKAAELEEFQKHRNRILQLWEKIRSEFGKNWESVDLKKPLTFTDTDSKARIACGNFLLTEYLENCMSFEEKKAPSPKNQDGPAIRGVHPQTILAPKK